MPLTTFQCIPASYTPRDWTSLDKICWELQTDNGTDIQTNDPNTRCLYNTYQPRPHLATGQAWTRYAGNSHAPIFCCSHSLICLICKEIYGPQISFWVRKYSLLLFKILTWCFSHVLIFVPWNLTLNKPLDLLNMLDTKYDIQYMYVKDLQ